MDLIEFGAFNHMESEGGLHDIGEFPDRETEGGGLETRLHHALGERTQVAPARCRGAVRQFHREVREGLSSPSPCEGGARLFLGVDAGASQSRVCRFRPLVGDDQVAGANALGSAGGECSGIRVTTGRGEGGRRVRFRLGLALGPRLGCGGRRSGGRRRLGVRGRCWRLFNAGEQGQEQQDSHARGANLQTGRATWYDRPMKSVRSLPAILLPAALVLMSALVPRDGLAADPDAIDDWLDSVVLLVTGSAYCSGVVIDDTGLVATAYHCISNGRRVKAWVRPEPDAPADAEAVTAIGRTVAAEPKDDLALVRIPELAGKVQPMAIRDVLPRPGEPAFGLGHPFAPAAEQSEAMEGMLLWSVTEGIVSAVGPRLIQTDAALNPGNSGGPVVDSEGRIIGITSRKLQADNIAFAAGATRLRALVEDPEPPSLLGGDVALGVSWLGGSPLFGYDSRSMDVGSAMELMVRSSLRDRVVATAGVGVSSSGRIRVLETGRSWTPALEASLALRQRIGRGQWSTTVELGGRQLGRGWSDSDFDPRTGTWTVSRRPATGRAGHRRAGRSRRRCVADRHDPR